MFKLKNVEVYFKIDGKEQAKLCSLTDFIVGRSAKSDVQIDSTNVSRQHIKVMYRDGIILIEDLNSTNGTYLNGEKLRPGQAKAYESTDKLVFGLKEDVILRIVANEDKDESADLGKREQKIKDYNNQIGDNLEHSGFNHLNEIAENSLEGLSDAEQMLKAIEDERRRLQNGESPQAVDVSSSQNQSGDSGLHQAVSPTSSQESGSSEHLSPASATSSSAPSIGGARHFEVSSQSVDAQPSATPNREEYLKVEGEIKTLNLEKSTLMEDISSLKNEKQDLQKEVIDKDKEIESYNEKLNALKSQISNFETQNADQIRDSEEKGKIIRELLGEADKIRAIIRNLNDDVQKENETLNKIKQESDAVLKNLETEKLQVSGSITQLQSQQKTLADETKTKETEFGVLTQKVNDLSKIVQDLTAKSNDYQKLCDDKEKQIQDQITKVANLQNDFDSLISKINNKKTDSESLDSEISQRKVELSGLQAEISNLKSENDQLIAKNSELKDSVSTSQSQIDTLKSEIETLTADREAQALANQKAIEDAEAQRDEILNAAEASKQSILKEAEEFKINLEQEAQKLKESILAEAEQSKSAILSEAETAKQQIISEGQDESKRLVDESLAKSESIISEADLNAKNKLDKAHDEIQALRQKADEDVNKIITGAQNKGADIIAESKTDADTRLSEANEKSKHIIAKAKEEAERQKAKQQEETDEAWAAVNNEINIYKEKSLKEAEEAKARSLKESEKSLQDAKKEAQDTKLAAVRHIDEQKKIFEMTEKRRLQANAEKLKKELELVLMTKMKPYLNRQEPEALASIEGIIKGTVGAVLTGEVFDEGELLETMLEAKTLSQQKRVRSFWKMAAVASVAIVFMTFFGVPFLVEQFKDQARNIAEVARKEGQEKVEARKAETREALFDFFEPQKSDEFKENYTELVLYTNGYVDKVLDPDYREQWIIALQNYFTDELDLSENNLVPFIAMEANMIRELNEESKKINGKFIEQGIQRMRDIEDKFKKRLMLELSSEEDFKKIMKFQEKFYKEK